MPRRAVLTYINSSIGAQVAQGEQVAIVSDLGSFKAECSIADSYSDRMAVGGRILLRTGSSQLPGIISSINPQTKNGMIDFTVRLDEPDNKLLRSGLKDSEMAAFRNRTIGFVFQSFHLIQPLNVIDNVEMPLLYSGMNAKQRRVRAEVVLEQVGMSHRMHHMPSQLSGGQCQRVAIARAIACNPDIILADEPTGNLDSKMSAEIMRILLDLNEKEHRTIVMVTHNEQQAKQAHRIIRFFDGRQVE